MRYNIIRYKETKVKTIVKVLLVLITYHLSLITSVAQNKIVNPDISYAGTPRQCEIGGIAVEGVEGYEDFVLINLSQLHVGQKIEVPGSEITDAVKRYWKHGLFSDVAISADSIIDSKVYLTIHLTLRPRITSITYHGVKKSEREDLENKLGMAKGMSITKNLIDRAKLLATRYFDDKGYKNAEIEIRQSDDVTGKNQVVLDVYIDKKAKMRVKKIILDGNDKLADSDLKGRFFTKSALKTLHESGKLANLFKTKKKFTPERYADAKRNLVERYNELGFRDAMVIEDSVWTVDDKHVNVYLKIEEGEKYYLRNISWVGNTVVNTDYLNAVLGMKTGDVYNQKLMNKRLLEDDDAVHNYYYNNGYVFSGVEPADVNIVGDSIDVEVRITEGPQAHLNMVRIFGNDRLYEEVVRRELRTKPGDLFSKEALMRSAREIASMGYFDPESVSPDVKPNYEDGTVDINWNLEQKSNDQLELSLGWGQTGVIGRVGIKFNNFSLRNLLGKNKLRRGLLPAGDGEQIGLNFQTNGRYYSSYSANYSTGWFGGKRPNSFNVGVYYSKQSDVSSSYYNSAYMNNMYNYMYGYGSYNSSYYNYDSFLDDDKFVKLLGISVGWGKRLRWPDDYFQFSATLSYQRYMLQDWQYFIISNGNCNNINLGLALTRNSTDNPLFPRHGSDFSLSVTLTPPWSLFDGKDYKNLATRETYNNDYDRWQSEQSSKYKWVEYHKWKFKSRTYTALTSGQKCFVLMTRVEFGLLGSYNKHKRSPFETFYVGGDGMSGYSTSYAEETIGLRGYENGSISSTAYVTGGEWSGSRYSSYDAYAYDRFTLELRYPFLLGNTTIYGLGFLEAGNAWAKTHDFNPFDMKRSAGFGVRIFLPMVGLMGIDWAYGFDKVYNGGWQRGGGQFHFILGQEF